MPIFDPRLVRQQLPSISHNAGVYLDNAATTPMPQSVIDTLVQYHSQQVGNVHRGQHKSGQQATQHFEQARQTVADFLNAPSKDNIVWTRGTTESLNLLANTYGATQLTAGDEILVSVSEHHANFVPWQQIAKQTGANLVVLPLPKEGKWDESAYLAALNENTKIVALAHVTNVLGETRPLKRLIQQAHEFGAIVVIDGAQGVQHDEVDVQALDVDFYAFSGHKLFAASGIGALYGKTELLDALPPWQFGGKMVKKVDIESTAFERVPARFEAGTPNVGGALSFASAIQWHQQWDLLSANQHIQGLQAKLFDGLSAIDGVKLLSAPDNGSGIVTFVVDGEHPSDIAMLVDQQNVALRAGHHCAHPLHDALNLKGSLRFSIALYNTEEDIQRAIAAVKTACELF